MTVPNNPSKARLLPSVVLPTLPCRYSSPASPPAPRRSPAFFIETLGIHLCEGSPLNVTPPPQQWKWRDVGYSKGSPSTTPNRIGFGYFEQAWLHSREPLNLQPSHKSHSPTRAGFRAQVTRTGLTVNRISLMSRHLNPNHPRSLNRRVAQRCMHTSTPLDLDTICFMYSYIGIQLWMRETHPVWPWNEMLNLDDTFAANSNCKDHAEYATGLPEAGKR
jgi:hypothetical protein